MKISSPAVKVLLLARKREVRAPLHPIFATHFRSPRRPQATTPVDITFAVFGTRRPQEGNLAP
eukprot:10683526-Lingulodinium_polyedra.AAC.1